METVFEKLNREDLIPLTFETKLPDDFGYGLESNPLLRSCDSVRVTKTVLLTWSYYSR